jgi:hypothetical protein
MLKSEAMTANGRDFGHASSAGLASTAVLVALLDHLIDRRDLARAADHERRLVEATCSGAVE